MQIGVYLLVWLSFGISDESQSIGTLCVSRNHSDETCLDFQLEQLPFFENPHEVTSLKISEVDLGILDPSIFESFINLHELTIEDNNFEILNGPFPVLKQLEKLTITGNALDSIYWERESRENRDLHDNGSGFNEKKILKLLTDDAYEALLNGEHAQDIISHLYAENEDFEIDPDLNKLLMTLVEGLEKKADFFPNNAKRNAFVNLKQLKFLNISYNKLSKLNVDVKFVLPNLESVDLSGNLWNCSEHMIWINSWNVFKSRLNETYCGTAAPVLNGIQISRALSLIHKLDLQCPVRCECSLDRVPKSKAIEASAVVNCSGLGLTRLPEELPMDVILTLDLKNNSVSDLRPLASSQFYRRLNRLFLDNNNISSLSGLEGSAWLSNIHALSLQENKLSYTFLAKHSKNIKDVGFMRCASREGDLNSNKKVTEVALESVCVDESDGTIEIMNLINVALALFTLLLIGNLCYDYYQFRKTGRIPWIVTKMP
ncbi:hypothetical protein QYM36_007786 [Artemia franciscana]|uniref:LRRNT domain-containing protein n=1 Tax=Artemia franciscana TaxID=6661 RepID=A0AA88I9Y9_ARTSF|nr:hypothetical protein QYM36_007786 [Artemia franciscana]